MCSPHVSGRANTLYLYSVYLNDIGCYSRDKRMSITVSVLRVSLYYDIKGYFISNNILCTDSDRDIDKIFCRN